MKQRSACQPARPQITLRINGAARILEVEPRAVAFLLLAARNEDEIDRALPGVGKVRRAEAVEHREVRPQTARRVIFHEIIARRRRLIAFQKMFAKLVEAAGTACK